MKKISSNIPRILGVILAGGRGSRMGGCNKFLLKIGNKSIISHIHAVISTSVDSVVLNCNDPNIKHQTDLQIISDIVYEGRLIGPMGGLHSSLNFAKLEGYEKVVTVPGDTPFIPDNFVDKLLKNSKTSITIACSQGRRHPLCGLWHVSILDELSTRIEKGNYKMMDWLDHQNVTEVEWDDDLDPFFNINTESDLEIAKQLYKER